MKAISRSRLQVLVGYDDDTPRLAPRQMRYNGRPRFGALADRRCIKTAVQ